jgi:peroxiredoxin|tara:strand:- start:2665 stop:3162 length:498 start_codon:yes stop_codon:yes gene_type:complete
MSLFDFEQYDSKQVPSGEIHLVNQTNDEIESINLDQYIEDRNVILIGIPGAFTPTCTEKHLPGFVKNENSFYKKGIQEIICMSVNDPHVMSAFADFVNFEGSKITMASDPFGEIAEQLGLLTDMGILGKRSKRFAAIIKKGKIVDMVVDERDLDVSSAENCLKKL